MVVSLPGLDVSPGDLFVSNGVADILNGSNFSGKTMCCVIDAFVMLFMTLRAKSLSVQAECQ